MIYPSMFSRLCFSGEVQYVTRVIFSILPTVLDEGTSRRSDRGMMHDCSRTETQTDTIRHDTMRFFQGLTDLAIPY